MKGNLYYYSVKKYSGVEKKKLCNTILFVNIFDTRITKFNISHWIGLS